MAKKVPPLLFSRLKDCNFVFPSMDIKLLLLLATFLMGALGDFVSRGAESFPHLDGSACLAQMDGKLPYYVPRGFQFSGKVRRYFMAAEIQPWDYTPTGTLAIHLVIYLLFE